MQRCPFCGAAESDRLDLEGQRFIVFACMFTPSVDPTLTEDELAKRLADEYAGRGAEYFRGMCDALHLVVAREPSPPAGPG